jgi:predicted ATPase/class 3 adenylate cyclase
MHQLPSGTVTLLFSDIEESTRLLQQLGTQYSELLTTCRHLQRTAFQHHHGHEVDTQGDSIFAAFARASDAVAAAVAAQRALANHHWPEGVSVRVRMGLHTGEPKLSAEGYVGLDVHRAARIMSCAHGGQILLSQTTRALVEHDLPTGVSLCELGAHRLKDLQQPIHLFQLVISDLPADFPPLLTLDLHTHNLPVQLTSFIGREKEVAKISHLLLRDDVRLLTLTGPGGIGKTRLGLQVAAELSEHFADGVFFVNLAPITDPSLVLPTIAQTLGVQESAMRSVLNILQSVLQEKQMLLVLDNFEQVVSAAVEVAALLASCHRLKVLVTSRATLRLSGEHQFPITPLTLPDPGHLPELVALSQYEAVALFLARATAARLDFQVDNATAPAVAEICVRLDGLPLAIELAAARITLLSPQALLARLGQRLALLTGGVRDAPARQQTLRSTIAWSYDLLEATEQRLFRRLCVFVGGMTFSAVEAVSAALGDEPVAVLDGITSLIDKSFLRQSEQEDEEPRFVMLETIREYGWEALSVSGEDETTRQAHAAYYLALTKEAAPQLLGPQLAQWMRRLEQELDNLRAAMSWLLEQGEAAMVLRMGTALGLFWQLHYSYHEGWNVLSRALEASEEVAVQVRARALVAAGWMSLMLGHFERAENLCQEGLALFRTIGDTAGMGHAVFRLAMCADASGDLAAARSRYQESLVLNRKAGNKTLIAWSLTLDAYDALSQGEYTGTRARLEESLTLFRGLGNPFGMAFTLYYLALYAIIGPGDLDLAQGHLLAEESLALFRDISSRNYEALALTALGEMTFLQGDTTTARLLLEQSCTRYREVGYEIAIARPLSLLGRVLAAEGDLGEAQAAYEESLILEMRGNAEYSFLDIAPALEGLAAVISVQGGPTWAARLLGRAEAQRETLGTPLPLRYRATTNRQSPAPARNWMILPLRPRGLRDVL